MRLIKPILLSDEVEALLVSAGLQVSDIRDSSKVSFFGIVEEKQLNGVIGVEKYSTVGLLRSLAVNTAARKAGYAMRLVQMLGACPRTMIYCGRDLLASYFDRFR